MGGMEVATGTVLATNINYGLLRHGMLRVSSSVS